MGPKVHPETIHERSVRLRALGERKKDSFRGRLVGTEQRVLVLRERSTDGRLVGLTRQLHGGPCARRTTS